MRCEEAREFIITDYIDGELKPEGAALVRKHVEECASCRALEARVRESAVSPFKGAAEILPPERVWRSVERGITRDTGSYGILEKARDAFKRISSIPGIRPAMAAISIAIFLTAFAGYQRYASELSLNTFIEDEISFVYQANGNGDDEASYYVI